MMQVEEGRPLAPDGIEIATTSKLCGPVFFSDFFDQHFWIWIFGERAGDRRLFVYDNQGV